MGACSDPVGAIPTSQHPLVPFISMPPSISHACFGCGKASSVQLFATPTETHRSPSGHSSLQSKSLLFLEPFCARKLPAAPFTHGFQGEVTCITWSHSAAAALQVLCKISRLPRQSQRRTLGFCRSCKVLHESSSTVPKEMSISPPPRTGPKVVFSLAKPAAG